MTAYRIIIPKARLRNCTGEFKRKRAWKKREKPAVIKYSREVEAQHRIAAIMLKQARRKC